MSTRQRIGFAVLAAVVAAVAVVLLRPDESSERADDPGERAGQTSTNERAGGGRGTGGGPAAPPEEVDPVRTYRLALQGGQVPGGGDAEIAATSGEQVTLVVTSATPDEIHVHGYDLTQDAGPGDPARFRFEADIEGSFEIESHAAEDAGLEPSIADLVVEPS